MDMDPVTHAVIGIVIGTKGGGGLTLNNAALAAATLGAVAPDLDIVAHLWGEYAYLKQHRAFSHSIPGIICIALATAGLLCYFYPGTTFGVLTLWAFYGALSHSLLDLLNSYGVEFFWPLSRKKWTANLLEICDPILLVLGLYMIFEGRKTLTYSAAGALGLYLVLRFFLRYYAWHIVRNRLAKKYPGIKVTILPSMPHLFRWEFIASTPKRKIVGSIDLFRGKFNISHRLNQVKADLHTALTDSILGRLFCEFTPFFHVDCRVEGEQFIGRFMDLRYRVKGGFRHNGTLIMDKDLKVKEAVFQPFNESCRINL